MRCVPKRGWLIDRFAIKQPTVIPGVPERTPIRVDPLSMASRLDRSHRQFDATLLATADRPCNPWDAQGSRHQRCKTTRCPLYFHVPCCGVEQSGSSSGS
jgi:hypothetical protein